jgi:hypothetical protein
VPGCATSPYSITAPQSCCCPPTSPFGYIPSPRFSSISKRDLLKSALDCFFFSRHTASMCEPTTITTFCTLAISLSTFRANAEKRCYRSLDITTHKIKLLVDRLGVFFLFASTHFCGRAGLRQISPGPDTKRWRSRRSAAAIDCRIPSWDHHNAWTACIETARSCTHSSSPINRPLDCIAHKRF